VIVSKGKEDIKKKSRDEETKGGTEIAFEIVGSKHETTISHKGILSLKRRWQGKEKSKRGGSVGKGEHRRLYLVEWGKIARTH